MGGMPSEHFHIEIKLRVYRNNTESGRKQDGNVSSTIQKGAAPVFGSGLKAKA